MNRLRHLLNSDAPGATLLIRLLVGSVFVSEGIQKFLFPIDLGGSALSLDSRLHRAQNHV